MNDWIITYSGRVYHPLRPRAEEVVIEDIANALAKLCRFGGHTRTHYSVAEHCVHVSHLVPHQYALQALLHDATEAYVVDVPTPVKMALGSVYSEIEHANWVAIAQALDVPVHMDPCVKEADRAMLAAERDQLLPAGGPDWGILVKAPDVAIYGWDWQRARDEFMRRYDQLIFRPL
jgi:hypothetical protein